MMDYDWFDYSVPTAAEYRGRFRVFVAFEDGTGAEIDLSHVRQMGGVFEPLHDEREFAKLRFDPGLGTIVWPNGADIAPETLYHLAKGRRLPEESPAADPPASSER